MFFGPSHFLFLSFVSKLVSVINIIIGVELISEKKNYASIEVRYFMTLMHSSFIIEPYELFS